MFEVRDENPFVGFVGLSVPRLGPDRWGHGYATEGAKAVLSFGFETLGRFS